MKNILLTFILLLSSCDSVFPIPINPAFYFSQRLPDNILNNKSHAVSNFKFENVIIYGNNVPLKYTSKYGISHISDTHFKWNDFSSREGQKILILNDKMFSNLSCDIGKLPYIIWPSSFRTFICIQVNDEIAIEFGENEIITHFFKPGMHIYVRKINSYEIELRNAILDYVIRKNKERNTAML